MPERALELLAILEPGDFDRRGTRESNRELRRFAQLCLDRLQLLRKRWWSLLRLTNVAGLRLKGFI